MILVKFTKMIDGKSVAMKDVVYAQSRLHVPDYMGRDATWDVTEEDELEDIDARVVAEVAKNGYAIVKVTHIIAKPFVERA